MGRFDSFYDAAGDEYQSKAFGEGMKAFHIGDRVPATCHRPLTAVEYGQSQAGTFDASNGLAVSTYQAVTNAVEDPTDPRPDGPRWIQVTDGVFTGISTRRDPALPAVSYTGRVHPPAETAGRDADVLPFRTRGRA